MRGLKSVHDNKRGPRNIALWKWFIRIYTPVFAVEQPLDTTAIEHKPINLYICDIICGDTADLHITFTKSSCLFPLCKYPIEISVMISSHDIKLQNLITAVIGVAWQFGLFVKSFQVTRQKPAWICYIHVPPIKVETTYTIHYFMVHFYWPIFIMSYLNSNCRYGYVCVCVVKVVDNVMPRILSILNANLTYLYSEKYIVKWTDFHHIVNSIFVIMLTYSENLTK